MTRTKFTFEYRGSKKRSRFDATYDADTREKRRVPGSTFHANTPRHIAKTCRDYRRPEIRHGGTKVLIKTSIFRDITRNVAGKTRYYAEY